MEKIKLYFGHMGMEIPLCLYMLTSYLKYPVFQNLIYEKVCFSRYNENKTLCTNVSAYYEDKEIQSDANYFYFLSSLVLTVPSLISGLILGAGLEQIIWFIMFREDDTRTDGLINKSCPYRYLPASDFWSIKVPLLIPFVGLIVCTANYIVQTIYIHSSVYLLLISDGIFGISGGYISVISTTLSYGVKTSSISHRSYRIAGVEGAIGLGGTIGYILSGTFRQAFGYSYTFLFMLVLQVVGFFYILILGKDSKAEVDEDGTDEGLSDIQYSYLRYKLSWGDKEYGWFSGFSFGLNTIMVALVYLLKSFLSACWPSSAAQQWPILSFVSSSHIFVFTAFNRFVSTGFRAFISNLIQSDEQGMMFSLIAVLEGLTTLLATSLFNNLYPKTLSFFPGLCYVASALMLSVSLLALGISDLVVKKESALEIESQRSDLSSNSL
uniref:Battenin n=1 Tax=Heterorhabditis bacteriophora TaxID=37862 RepID=A0A1I7XAM0_HETBA